MLALRPIRSAAAATLWTLALLTVACDDGGEAEGEEQGSQCPAGAEKCDTPVGDDAVCKTREAEVLDSSQRGFTPTDIRWACADVEGVNTVGGDDRGQEYCEYYAIFKPPAAPEGDAAPASVDLGRNLSGGGHSAGSVCLPGDQGEHCRVTLTEDQQFALEDAPSDVVGACVFTSWHQDVGGPLPACEGGACDCETPGSCEGPGAVLGFPLTPEFFRMKISFNSNRAAADLVSKCIQLDELGHLREYDWQSGGAEDDWRSPFFRGCVGANALYGTGWRRSDPTICAVVNRLRECGCGVPGVETAAQLGDALIPPQPGDGQTGDVTLRGFQLATWDDRQGVPPGCRYAEIGENSQAVVLCDITSADLLAHAQDPKEFCRSTYGNNVVVHIPIPTSAITCETPETPEAASCGAVPWNIGDENPAGA